MAKRSRSKSKGNNRLILLAFVLVIALYFYNNPQQITLPDLPVTDQPTKPPQKTSPKSSNIPASTNKSTNAETYNFAFEKDANFGLPTFTDDEQIIRHEAFTLNYAEKYEQAAWVAYQLTAGETRGDAERGNDFRPDPLVKTGSALPEDYRGSGYDRGHLAPAADFKDSPKRMSESFYMSNMSPQVPEFNRGIWSDLENQVRRWARRDKALYIVTGPVLKGKMAYIGKRNKVAVPPKYYKVILDLTPPELKGIGFIMKNEGSSQPVKSFAVTIDQVEKETGLDFFPQLPSDLEKELEGTVNVDAWFKR